MGFGAMYWLEGVVVRRRDSRSRAEAAMGNSAALSALAPRHDELVVTLRVNNNALCNLGAVVAGLALFTTLFCSQNAAQSMTAVCSVSVFSIR
jgi:hypothetical protein